MEITITFSFGEVKIVRYKVGNLVLWPHLRGAVKHDFELYIIQHSNALDFVTRHLIGYRRKLDFITYVTFRWMAYGFILLATLQIKTKLQKRIRLGITIFKNFIWGGIHFMAQLTH